MTDPTNDIDGLLGYLSLAADHSLTTIPSNIASDYYAALTALVAERHKLAADLRWKHEQYDMLSNSANMNAQRIRDLERQLEAQPSADRDRDRDRELRELLVCAALHGSGCRLVVMKESDAKELGRQSVWIVNGALAAMRKGESDAS